MDDTDRLSSYLDGGLEPDEQLALEAELAGDAALRARLAELRRVDEELARVAASALPAGARERLDARLGPVVAEVLAAATPVAAAAPTTSEALGRRDELAARRGWRRLPVAVGGIAAAVALLAVGVVGLDQLGPVGGDDETATMALDAADDAAEDGAEMAELSPEAAPDARALLPELPVVVADGRQVRESDLDLALAAGPLHQVTSAALSGPEATELATRSQTRLLGPGETPAEEADEPTEEAGDAAVADADPALTTTDGQLLDAADIAVVQRCVAELLEDDTAAIPVLVELLEVDGVAALQVGLVTPDPATGAYTRAEIWTLEQATCQVLRFAQS